MADQDAHLTEVILTIQHEVQLALDYIETVAHQEASELGAAPSAMTVENLRIRVPLVFQPQQESRPAPAKAPPPVLPLLTPTEQIPLLKARLPTRSGLLLKTDAGQQIFSKIRVVTPPVVPSETPPGKADTPPRPVGEIEMTFTRVPRELTLPAAETPTTGENNGDGDKGVKGDGNNATPGPKDGPSVKKLHTIGSAKAKLLAKIGIETVGQLSRASAEDIATALKTNTATAQRGIDQARLFFRLSTAGLSNRDINFLLKTRLISSLEKLAEADPAALHKRLPRSLKAKASLGVIESWVEKARLALGR